MKNDLKILEFRAENFKALELLYVRPDGQMVQFTGGNGAGKTSAVDAIWFLLKGIKGLPVKAVRKGANSMEVKGRIGGEEMEFIVTRRLGAGDNKLPSLDIEMIKGTRDTTPQDFLDRIFDLLTFDPLEFVRMSAKEQVAKLRMTAHIDLDFEALATEQEMDYKARHAINQQARELEALINGMDTQEGLPKEKFDEAAIMRKLETASEQNRKAQELFRAKHELEDKARRAAAAVEDRERAIELRDQEIETVKKRLEDLKGSLKELQSGRKELAHAADQAKAEAEAAPAGETVDMVVLTAELTSAQRTNRAIDAWRRKEELKGELQAKKLRSDDLTRTMNARDEKKRVTVAKAKIPIEGLQFNDAMTEVTFNNMPLESMSTGEQMRLSARIGMAANPKLHVMCVRHGEALDESGMASLAELAAEYNFQIWMSRVGNGVKGLGTILRLKDGKEVQAEG
jgi:DNA repair exonuclease SbcCD ATPase subunit